MKFFIIYVKKITQVKGNLGEIRTVYLYGKIEMSEYLLNYFEEVMLKDTQKFETKILLKKGDFFMSRIIILYLVIEILSKWN